MNCPFARNAGHAAAAVAEAADHPFVLSGPVLAGSLVLALAGSLAAGPAAAAVLVSGPVTLTYDDTTAFGAMQGLSLTPSGRLSFEFTVPATARATQSVGSYSAAFFAPAPTITLSAAPGWQFAGTAELAVGDFQFNTFGFGTLSLLLYARSVVDGDVTSSGESVGPIITSQSAPHPFNPVLVQGLGRSTTVHRFAANAAFELGAGVDAIVLAGNFTTVYATPETTLRYALDLQPLPVPEPASGSLLVAGLLAAAAGRLHARRADARIGVRG